MNTQFQRLLLSVSITLAPAAQATMGSAGSTYGLFADDIATTQALSLFSNHAQAAFYNPSYLARDRAGALDTGAMFAKPDINAKPWGTGPSDATGQTNYLVDNGVQNDPNYMLSLGFKTDLGKLLKDNPAMVFGLTLIADRGASQLVALNSSTSSTAQSLRYGSESLFLNLGAGINPFRGLYLGAGTSITLSATANLQTNVGLQSGNAQFSQQSEQIKATPQARPILSGTLNWGEILCPNDKYCWAKGLETALTWRGESAYSSKINGNVYLPATGTQQPLIYNTLDTYAPETFSGGVQYDLYKLRIGAMLDFQRWSKLNQRLAGDTTYQGSGLEFRDVIVPRAGFEYRADNELSYLGGVSYERSPLKSSQSFNVNFIDNDALVAGLGFSYLIDKPILFALPLRLDMGYQYRYLVKRDFLMSDNFGMNPQTVTSCKTGANCEYVTAKGGVQVLNASVHMKF